MYRLFGRKIITSLLKFLWLLQKSDPWLHRSFRLLLHTITSKWKTRNQNLRSYVCRGEDGCGHFLYPVPLQRKRKDREWKKEERQEEQEAKNREKNKRKEREVEEERGWERKKKEREVGGSKKQRNRRKKKNRKAVAAPVFL